MPSWTVHVYIFPIIVGHMCQFIKKKGYTFKGDNSAKLVLLPSPSLLKVCLL